MRPPFFRPSCLVISLLLAACGQTEPLPPDHGNAKFSVRESIAQLHVTHAVPGTVLTVLDGAKQEVAHGTADELGSLVFRRLTPGTGFTVRAAALSPVEEARNLTVLSLEGSRPDPAAYAKQVLVPGYQYLTMRDGTTLSAYVTLPGPIDEGPYPTIVNYSGYSPSKPGAPLNGGEYANLCAEIPVLCDAPDDPSALIAAVFGYATVSVNIRGTGCSGGAYDYFETLQNLDGYDVIEIAAAQDWVFHHHVGMTGLSYPGISQLFVAREQPPHLAAITPLSVIGGTSSTLVPGGILNDGFALSWVRSVLSKAAPYGQGWEQARVDGGDTICRENQLLHAQRVDNVQQARDMPFYVPEVVGPLDPERFVDRIQVPVYLAGGFQDEQTGPFFAALLDKFTHASAKRFTVYNGVHVDGFAPAVLAEWKAFLDIYVAEKVPALSGTAILIAPQIFETAFGSKLPLPESRFAKYATWEEAKAAFEAAPPLRILFENGAGKADDPGAPVPAFEKSFTKWPPAETSALRLYFQPEGMLETDLPPADGGSSSFLLDPDAGERGILASGSVWDKQPNYDWREPPANSAVIFLGEPLAKDLVMAGTGSVDLWVRSTADDADLEVNVTEVRPDGAEQYVQSGWLRASERKLAADATELWPAHTYLEADAQPVSATEWSATRVGIAPFAHVFRAGSRIRVSVDTPGDSRSDWRFLLKTFPGPVTHTIAHDAAHTSSVVLPVLAGVDAPTPLPVCASLRGEQCRPFVPYTNTSP